MLISHSSDEMKLTLYILYYYILCMYVVHSIMINIKSLEIS